MLLSAYVCRAEIMASAAAIPAVGFRRDSLMTAPRERGGQSQRASRRIVYTS